jgi:hypothetical protein
MHGVGAEYGPAANATGGAAAETGIPLRMCSPVGGGLFRDMRTNIDIDDQFLKLLIRTRQQAGMRALFGKVSLDIDLQQTRQGRRLDRGREFRLDRFLPRRSHTADEHAPFSHGQ